MSGSPWTRSLRYAEPPLEQAFYYGAGCSVGENYSNADGTPWVYKHRGLGKLVGAPVPGTMTSVNWVRMQDPTLVFGIPVVGYRLPDGSYLENAELDPDIYVLNAPETIVKGEDTQLKAAVDELLKEIDKK